MTSETESRIQDLCRKLLSLTTEAELELAIAELRETLCEHVREARASLEDQATTLSLFRTIVEPE